MTENANKDEYLEDLYFKDLESDSFYSKVEKFFDSRYFVAICFVLMAISAFMFGRLSAPEAKKEPIKILSNNSATKPSSTTTNQTASVGTSAGASTNTNSESEQVVGSKNSNKYHYPWCVGAKQISEQNKITFNSIEEAKSKGYMPASNCKGLK